jgi:hypothetical protein
MKFLLFALVCLAISAALTACAGSQFRNKSQQWLIEHELKCDKADDHSDWCNEVRAESERANG